MSLTPYIYQLAHRPASHARVLLNGVPLYDRAPQQNVTPRGPVTHWLLTGENTVTIDLLPAPPNPRAPFMGPHFAMAVGVQEDEASLFSWVYPTSVAEVGLEPKIPWAHAAAFVVTEDLPKPIYYSGSPEDFPVEGTPAQKEAVAELYNAFGSGDGARFSAAMDLKFTEFERYYGPQPGARSDAVSRLSEPWEMDPLDPDDLRFDSYVDGRVAYVRRLSGKPAVRAQHREIPFAGWGTDLFLTRLDGRWRVFR